MRGVLFLIVASAMLSAKVGDAFELSLPEGARPTHEQVETWDEVVLPVSVWADERVETLRLEGASSRRSWHVLGSGQSTAQLMAPLREQLLKAGFDVLFECEARACGGFDFRYAIDVLPEPVMHVDLGDFRVLTAARSGPGEHAGLLVSRSTERGFVQLVTVKPSGADPRPRPTSSGNVPEANRPPPNPAYAPAPAPIAVGELGSRLLAEGHTALPDLSFQTGSSQLADQPFASLAEVGAFLKSHPDAVIMLVGHTDTDGALAANISLSKNRAAAVLQRLSDAHGIERERMRAEGAGFLAPIASNVTEEGRTANRRVEVILTNPE